MVGPVGTVRYFILDSDAGRGDNTKCWYSKSIENNNKNSGGACDFGLNIFCENKIPI